MQQTAIILACDHLNDESFSCNFFRAWFLVMYCTALPACPCAQSTTSHFAAPELAASVRRSSMKHDGLPSSVFYPLCPNDIVHALIARYAKINEVLAICDGFCPPALLILPTLGTGQCTMQLALHGLHCGGGQVHHGCIRCP